MSIKDRLGHMLAYEYYPAGHLLSLTNQNGEKYRFEYDAAGRLTQEARIDKAVLEYHYDDRGLLSKVDHIGDSGGIQAQRSNLNRHFSYNALDELIELTDSLKGNRKYQYDAEGRLQTYHSAIFPDIPGSGDWESFSYDAADNILNQHPTSLSAHDDSIKTNRVNDYNGEIYTYNEWGDLLSIYHQQKRRGFKFNAEGLLVSSSGQHAGKNYSVAYEYDALDRRIQKSVSYFEDEHLEKLKEQKETHFLWMGMQMIEEREYCKKGMTQ